MASKPKKRSKRLKIDKFDIAGHVIQNAFQRGKRYVGKSAKPSQALGSKKSFVTKLICKDDRDF